MGPDSLQCGWCFERSELGNLWESKMALLLLRSVELLPEEVRSLLLSGKKR
jgi:hypothetical protein